MDNNGVIIKDEEKTKEQLLDELESLRNELAESKKAETKCRWAEESLMESEERYKCLIETITDYIYTVKVENGRPVATIHGLGCIGVTGYTSEQYMIHPNLWYEMIHEEDRKAVLEQAERILSGAAVNPLEHRIIHKDGSIRWLRNTSVPHYDKEGHLVLYDGIIEDITESKKAEESIQRSKKEWEATFDAITYPLFIHDREFSIVRANIAYRNAAGMKFKEFIGKPYYEIFPKMEKPFKMCLNVQELQEEKEEEYSCPLTNRIFKVSFYPIKDAEEKYLYSIHSLEDITEAKKAEEKIKKLSQSVEQSPSIVMITDVKGNIEYVNPKFTEITGYTSKEIIGINAGDLGTQSPEEYRQMWETISSGRKWSGAFLNRKKSGEYFWEAASISAIMDLKGVITNFIKVAEDITERKRTEDKIRQQIEELERFKKAIIQRELRMKELKDKIKEMEKGK